jgi:predicted nucleic acid-binding protein
MPDLRDSVGLVLDTSVWINLLASQELYEVLRALAVPCHAPEQVIAEIERDPVTGMRFDPQLHPLRRIPARVSIVALEGTERDVFLDIVGASSPDALGDGEAATIAIAASRNLDIAIDDRKARRIIRDRFSNLRMYWTVELLQATSVSAVLGTRRAAACFDNARRFGRMHVPRG